MHTGWKFSLLAGVTLIAVDAASAQAPRIHVPRFEAPRVNVPRVNVPRVNVPRVQAPRVNVPRVAAPKVNVPRVAAPKVNVPRVAAPKVNAPRVAAPKVNVPRVRAPKVGAPRLTAPSTALARTGAPRLAVPGSRAGRPSVPRGSLPIIGGNRSRGAAPLVRAYRTPGARPRPDGIIGVGQSPAGASASRGRANLPVVGRTRFGRPGGNPGPRAPQTAEPATATAKSTPGAPTKTVQPRAGTKFGAEKSGKDMAAGRGFKKAVADRAGKRTLAGRVDKNSGAQGKDAETVAIERKWDPKAQAGGPRQRRQANLEGIEPNQQEVGNWVATGRLPPDRPDLGGGTITWREQNGQLIEVYKDRAGNVTAEYARAGRAQSQSLPQPQQQSSSSSQPQQRRRAPVEPAANSTGVRRGIPEHQRNRDGSVTYTWDWSEGGSRFIEKVRVRPGSPFVGLDGPGVGDRELSRTREKHTRLPDGTLKSEFDIPSATPDAGSTPARGRGPTPARSGQRSASGDPLEGTYDDLLPKERPPHPLDTQTDSGILVPYLGVDPPGSPGDRIFSDLPGQAPIRPQPPR